MPSPINPAGKRDTPAPWLHIAEPTLPSASRTLSPSRKQMVAQWLQCSPDPSVDVIPTYLPNNGTLCFDLIFGSQAQMTEFQSAVRARGTKVSELLSHIGSKSQRSDRWCVRVVTQIPTMHAPLTVLFEAYPKLFWYVLLKVRQEMTIKLERNANPS